MKGIVFCVLGQMVESRLGLEGWNQVLDIVQPRSGGVYTTGETYVDEELLSLVNVVSKKMGMTNNAMLREFGLFAMKSFSELYPHFFEGHTLRTFLESIHDVVHVEVRKLYMGATPPTFRYETATEKGLVMTYESTRKLCSLGEGLIEGAARYFQVAVSIHHTACMHRGDSHCRFEIMIGESSRERG